MARKICEILGLNTVSGDLGIEIEVEGNREFPSEGPDNWRAEPDGSLRGNSMEYIIESPIKLDEVSSHIDALLEMFAERKIKVHDSFRAGVHVHLNVQQLTPYQLGTLAAVYYTLETALVRFCGPTREGNYHCLRREDAEYSYIALCDTLRTGDFEILATDNLRYASLNLRAISRYGSLEFRSMATRPGFQQILPWCTIISRMRDYAVKCPNRQELAYDFSVKGYKLWAEDIIGEDMFKLIEYEGMEKEMIRNLRHCQTLIYLGDTNE